MEVQTNGQMVPAGQAAIVEAKAAILRGNWGEFKGDATDILIPKILLAQSTSKAVQDERVGFGQLYKSTTFDVIGGKDKPVAITPLHYTKNWVLSKKVGGKFEFQKFEPFTEANRDFPWDFEEAGTPWKREAVLSFFVLVNAEITKDLEARKGVQERGEIPDIEASLVPSVLAFKSTSYKAGKTLVTHFAKAAEFGLPPFVNYFNLTTEKVTNEQGTFYVLVVDRGGKTSDEHLAACHKWHTLVARSGAVKVDNSDLQGHSDAAQGASAMEY